MQEPILDIQSADRFRLTDNFIAPWRTKQPAWGPVGEITYRRTYSRKKDDGTHEQWWETVRRVVEGSYTYQKWHCRKSGLPWNGNKAQKSAQTMFRLIFYMKFLPPGRGLWMCGTPYVERKGGAALNNCGFTSTRNIATDFSDPFTFLMDFSMLGVGIGGDTLGAGTVVIKEPKIVDEVFEVEDSREGWVDLVRRVLESYAGGTLPSHISYDKVRPEGSPINGFGGTASGPGDLIKLVQGIHDTLRPLIGKPITSEAIVDLFDRIGVCVVAGNVRRSAIIMLGEADDTLFADLKNPEKYQEQLNDFRWASNNSILAEIGMNYADAAERTAKNGEPGYLWMDTARAFGRLKDAANFADDGAIGTNPCSFAGETIVQTTLGPKRIDALAGQQFWALVNGKAHLSPRGSWVTGVDDIYQLKTKQGFEVAITANHKVMLDSGEWIEAGKLEAGHKIVVHDHDGISWPGAGTLEQGYLCGLLLGDGHFESKRPILNVWKDDEGHEPVLVEALRCAETLPHRADWEGWRDHGRGVYALSVGSGIEQFGFASGAKHITESTEVTSSDFHVGFLRGLFDADGHVEGNTSAGFSVRLGQSHYGDLVAVQRMLARLGVFSKIYDAKPAGESILPDGNGGVKAYKTKESWRLAITSKSLHRFAERIGFKHANKSTKLAEAVACEHYQPRFVAEFESLTFLRRDNVWDLTVSDVHAFDAQGLYVSNSEQTLWDMELCNLVETFPSTHSSFEEYRETLKFAYLYAKSITLVPTHNPKTNAMTMKNRRIGCSQTGIIDSMVRHGRREHLRWCDEGYKYLQSLDKKYSDWLCIPRSLKITSVKPSGTVSLLPGVNPGIHYPHAEYYYRTIRIAKTSPLLGPLTAAGYRIEDSVTDSSTKVVYFPIHEPYFDRSKDDVSMWEQLENAAAMQYYWADNQVSVTVTFKPEEAGDIKSALELYESRLKSVSFLPLLAHGYAQAPYQTITKEEYEAAASRLKPVVWGDMQHEVTDSFCDGDRCQWTPAA